MKILITGITGFVGTNLVKAWSDKHTLYGVHSKEDDREGVAKMYGWDNLHELPAVDAVVHLAGLAHETGPKSDSKLYFEVNTGLTQKIFDWFMTSEAHTFIFFSTVKVVAEVMEQEVLTEKTMTDPRGAYALSKRRAEKYLMSRVPECDLKGKRMIIVRPCMMHGPGNKGNLNLLYGFIKRGMPWPLGAFEAYRSFCAIDNVTFATEQLLVRREVESGVYHLCDDEPLATGDLIKTICHAMDRKPRIWNVPPPIINLMARVSEALHLPFGKIQLRKLTDNYVVSNQKLKNALNIERMPMNAADGVTHTVKSFEQAKKKKAFAG